MRSRCSRLRAAVPAADRGRRQDRQPADPAVPGGRRGDDRRLLPLRELRGAPRGAPEPRRARERPAEPRRSAADPLLGLAARPRTGCCSLAVALYALQALYSADHAKAAENVAFFYVPFGLLFVLLREVRWTRELLLALPRRGGRAGGRVRRDRLRRVRPQVAVPEPEGGRGEPVRQLLPRQLAVLRPEHLRALPGARDDRGDDRRAVESRRREIAARGGSCSRGCSAGW